MGSYFFAYISNPIIELYNKNISHIIGGIDMGNKVYEVTYKSLMDIEGMLDRFLALSGQTMVGALSDMDDKDREMVMMTLGMYSDAKEMALTCAEQFDEMYEKISSVEEMNKELLKEMDNLLKEFKKLADK